MAVGLVVVAIGLFGIVVPSLLLELGRSLLTPMALYMVAALRILICVVLVRVAPVSRMPGVLRALGIIIIIAGVLTPFFGVERSLAVLEWWSSQGEAFMRVTAGLPVAIGLFIIYAVTSPHGFAAVRRNR